MIILKYVVNGKTAKLRLRLFAIQLCSCKSTESNKDKYFAQCNRQAYLKNEIINRQFAYLLSNKQGETGSAC